MANEGVIKETGKGKIIIPDAKETDKSKGVVISRADSRTIPEASKR